MTLRQALNAATARLAEEAQLRATASRDAELLLLHVVRIPRVTLLAHPERAITEKQQAEFDAAIRRRLQNEPVQYITGEQEFYGLRLQVSSAVLIPRPETEHLVEAVLKLLPAGRPMRLADVGTGSGAIAIALAVHLPLASIIALDVSMEAIAVATRNAEENNVADRIRFVRSDLLSALGTEELVFDAIVSNPPYIPEFDRASLHPQVRDHEPAAALFAGENGLDIYERLIPQAYSALKPGGVLALEMGHGQQMFLADLLKHWDDVSFIDDLQGIARVVVAFRRAGTSAER